ncbi:hypothetical protein CYMTET_49653 [Cymbomonas tetramitiformis]|uniref:Uncharacterized protein n=1 Tax=Cymbomonas tetramitiformis TaxID=36881 RepID=A0AAE0BRF0_9CHLO|nr:hypothetical protein CYMTET_49653 [Cymbomonas tetramitiformis]
MAASLAHSQLATTFGREWDGLRERGLAPGLRDTTKVNGLPLSARIRAIAIFPFSLHCHITKHFWVGQSCNLTTCDVKEITVIVWLSKVC